MADEDGGTGGSGSTQAPALPLRPPLTMVSSSGIGSFRLSSRSSRPQLQSQATTALTLTGVQVANKTTNMSSGPANIAQSRSVSRMQSLTQLQDGLSIRSKARATASLFSDNASLSTDLDQRSILDFIAPSEEELSPGEQAILETLELVDDSFASQFRRELVEIPESASEQVNADGRLTQWKGKLKHFFVLSASGKPIYSRHGDDQLISNYVGIAQTIISFYQGEDDSLRGVNAGDVRLVFLAKGPLNLVAVSGLGESDSQLRAQLEALYMQILSTLTLPSMERMFSNRPSTDLRRPLQGTDVLLAGLADGFTRGSPSTLLSALECLRLRKTQRKVISDTFLSIRSPNLLYGLVVAAGRLVSVVRPKKHSLHPGDLHLIFNMLFEARGVKAGGGENWIPLCLPGFNNTGFLYMYVSFVATTTNSQDTPVASESFDVESPSVRSKDELAIILISANKESFFELRQMRDDLTARLESNGSMTAIRTAMQRGRLPCSEIVSGTVLQHFIYKSRANVQFVMPAFAPHFESDVARRRLITLYGQLHESAHNRVSRLKVQHVVSRRASALSWETPIFELYCVASPHTSRSTLARDANRVVQWVRREEERIFIVGGAVF